MNKFIVLLLVSFGEVLAATSLCEWNDFEIRSHLSQSSSRIAFKNDGGLINGGVCWWHSRLQRSSAYLIEFRPEERSPSKPELLKILHSLRVMDKTVVIPGYSDFETFSRSHQFEIQAMLNDWQLRDGFLNFQWIRGISGHSSLPSKDMKSRMDSVFNYFKNSPAPLWVMAQVKGITSHSLLIIDMKRNAHGYDLNVIDSNHPLETIDIEYHEGDTFLKAQGAKYSFVPYVGFQNDFRKIFTSLKKACPNRRIEGLDDILDGEIEKY